MTPVHPSAVPVVASLGGSSENFAWRWSQRLGLGLFGLLLVVLVTVVFRTSNNTVDSLKSVSDSGSAAFNMVITQRESLVFTVAFEQWLSGTITRRDLQIRRALLAQRLVVRDNTGVPNGSRIRSEYFRALEVLDNYMKLALPGFLLPDDQIALRSKSADALKQFTFESRELAIRITQGHDERTNQLIRHENSRRTNQYVIVLVVIALATLVVGFLGVSRLRDFRRIRVRMEDERQELEAIRTALQRTDLALASRLDKERMDRLDREWIDSTVRSISSQMKGTVVPDEIADTMVESVGRALGADFVIFYSLGKFRKNELWRQWSQTTATQIDFSRIAKYEPDILGFLKRLDAGTHAVVVSDSHLIDVSRGPFPEIVATSKELARSWVITPVGEAIHGLGYLWIGMVEDIRVWSTAEVTFIQRVSTDAAQVLAHAWMFDQSMQIAEHNAEVNRLVELDRVKNDFIENMNHELRTPLTSIIGYMEVVLGDVDSSAEPELASSLVAVQRNAIRLQILIENMMQLSKTDFQNVSLDVATVDVGHLLDDVVNSLHLGAEDLGVALALRLDSPAGDLMIDGDIGQLEQVFVNLMSNAIKFTPRGGTVTVAARSFHAERDFVEVKVTDTGIGIPSKEFPNVFKRFFRASTATEASIPGFGIGLSLVRSIVREHHGTVTFDSTVGVGTVFTVSLPTRYVLRKPTSGSAGS